MFDTEIIILGDGLLGQELVKQTGWKYISRKKDGIDATNFNSVLEWINEYEPSVIINCIAHTDTYSDDKELHMKINYEFVVNLTDICKRRDIKLVHISTDYVYAKSNVNASEEDVPVHCKTWYGYSKLLGESYVQLKLRDSLVIRCSHKPTPFPYDSAIVSQIGNFDYVDVIGELILLLIKNDSKGVFNVGTGVKTIYNLALKTKKDILPLYKRIHNEMPSDVTLSLDKMRKELDESNCSKS